MKNTMLALVMLACICLLGCDCFATFEGAILEGNSNSIAFVKELPTNLKQETPINDVNITRYKLDTGYSNNYGKFHLFCQIDPIPSRNDYRFTFSKDGYETLETSIHLPIPEERFVLVHLKRSQK